MEELLQDTRYALRTLRQKPGFAAIALLTLALGSGATTVMFTLVNSVLLKPLSYPQPDRLFTVEEQTEAPTQLGNLWAFSYPNFQDCARDARSLDLAAWMYGGGTVTGSLPAEHVDGFQISSGLFSVLGVPLVKGRAFQPQEDRLGGAPVAIISYSLWQRRYAGNPAAIGMPLILEGTPYTVVGIAPPGFHLNGDADVLTPLGRNTEPRLQNRAAHTLMSSPVSAPARPCPARRRNSP